MRVHGNGIVVVALALFLGCPAPAHAQETADSLTGLPGFEVSIDMRFNVEPVATALRSKFRDAGIRMVGAPAHLRLNAEVVRSDAPGVSAFVVELQLTQLVAVRANGRRVLVPTWSRRRLGLANETLVTAEVETTALSLVDDFIKAWASVNPR